MTTEQLVPTNGVATPPPDPDAAKYEALRKELGIEAEGQEPEPEGQDPEPQPEPEAEPEPEPQHVPRAEHENVQRALREAREQAKASETRFAKALEAIMQRQQPAAQEKKDEPAKIPDVNEDPIGHFTAQIALRDAKIEALERGSQQSTEQLQAQIQAQQAHAIAVASEAEILKTKPDYWDACKHLEGMRVAQLNAMYPDDSPQVAAYAQSQGFASVQDMKIATLENDRRTVLMHAIGMGVSPAELYYNIAVQTGYSAKPNGQQNGKDRGQQQIEAAARGRKASVSISGDSGGKKGAMDMSLTDLADLAIEDGEAFDKVWDQMQRAGKLG